jgi:hypothetical protein
MAGGVIPAKPRGIPGVKEALVLTACMALQSASLPANPPPLPARPDPDPKAGRGLAMPRGFPSLGVEQLSGRGGSLEEVGVGLANSNLESAQRSSI